jgi:hypothetical protein
MSKVGGNEACRGRAATSVTWWSAMKRVDRGQWVVSSGWQCTERTSKEEKGKSKGAREQVILTFAAVAEVHLPDTSGTLDSTQAIRCLLRCPENITTMIRENL